MFGETDIALRALCTINSNNSFSLYEAAFLNQFLIKSKTAPRLYFQIMGQACKDAAQKP